MTEKEPTLKDVVRIVNDLASATVAGLTDVRKEMSAGFAEIKKDNEDFAISVARGFNEVHEKIELGIQSVNFELSKKIDSLSFKMQVEFRNVEKRIDALELKIDQSDKLSKEDIVAIGDEVYHIKLRTKKLEQKIAKLKLAN